MKIDFKSSLSKFYAALGYSVAIFLGLIGFIAILGTSILIILAALSAFFSFTIIASPVILAGIIGCVFWWFYSR